MPFGAIETRRAYFRRRWRTLRDLWFKANGPCHRCGSWEDLQVDHVDPATKEAEAAIWNWSGERRTRELAKCQVLCRTCHREKSGIEERLRAYSKRIRARGLSAQEPTAAAAPSSSGDCWLCDGAGLVEVERDRYGHPVMQVCMACVNVPKP